MAFQTYGADEAPDLVGTGSVLSRKIDGVSNDSEIQLAPMIGQDIFNVGHDVNSTGSFNTRRITNVANPTDDADAATKGYVDKAVSGAGGVGFEIVEGHCVGSIAPNSMDVRTIPYRTPVGFTSDKGFAVISNINFKSSDAYITSYSIDPAYTGVRIDIMNVSDSVTPYTFNVVLTYVWFD